MQKWENRWGHAMRKVFCIDLSFPRYICGVHVKKFSKQPDRAL